MDYYGDNISDGKFIALLFGGIILLAALIIGAVFYFTRNEPATYTYCSSGWSAICLNSKTKLTPDANGCVSNNDGRLCQYEVNYGKF